MDSFFALFFRFSFGLLCHALLLPLITPCRFGRRACRWAWLGGSALGSLLAVPLILLVDSVGVLFVLEAAFTLALYCAAYMFLSEGSRMRSLFMFSVYGTYFMFLLAFASCLSQVFFAGSHYATAAIRTLFMALYGLSLRFSPLVRRLRATSQLSVGWRSPAVFSCSSCLTVYAAALIFSILQLDPGIRLGITGVLAALITSAYAVSGRMILLLGREQAAREAETQRKLMERQLAAEREYVAQAKAHRHDMRHHTALIQAYLDRGDTGGAREYLSQWQAQLDAAALDHYCENTVANALLRLTARRCREGDIPCQIQAAIPEELPLTGPELTAVLGNILENAWEAAGAARAPSLSVSARPQGGFLLVEVKNAVSGETRFEGGLPVTTKAAGGQGLRNAQRTLKRHGGLLQCAREGDTFLTRALLPL